LYFGYFSDILAALGVVVRGIYVFSISSPDVDISRTGETPQTSDLKTDVDLFDTLIILAYHQVINKHHVIKI